MNVNFYSQDHWRQIPETMLIGFNPEWQSLTDKHYPENKETQESSWALEPSNLDDWMSQIRVAWMIQLLNFFSTHYINFKFSNWSDVCCTNARSASVINVAPVIDPRNKKLRLQLLYIGSIRDDAWWLVSHIFMFLCWHFIEQQTLIVGHKEHWCRAAVVVTRLLHITDEHCTVLQHVGSCSRLLQASFTLLQ